MQIYIFSGLGADERVFQNLDFSGFNPIFIKWIVPHGNESIEHYATRLLDQIKSPKPTLIGLSFGGMMAIEVAKQLETGKLVLISSAKTKNEIPFYYRFAGQFHFHKLLPIQRLLRPDFITNWFFGVQTVSDKQLLKQILLDTNPVFLKWAIDKIARWTNHKTPKNIFHIHGSSDRILPLRFVRCDEAIKSGGHFMVLNKSKEVNSRLREIL